MDIINSGREKWNNRLFRVVNSAMAFCIAFMLINVGYFIITALAASLYNIKSTVFFHGVHFHALPKEWYKKNVLIIHSIGVLYLISTFLVGAVFYSLSKRKSLTLKLVFLWMSILSITMFCANFMTAAIGLLDFESPMYQHLSVTLAWLYIPPVLGFGAAFAMLIVLVAICFFSVRQFLVLAYSYRKVNKLKNRRKYFFEIMMLPTFLGAMFSFALIFPERYIFIQGIHIIYFCVFSIVGWYALFYVDVKYEDVVRLPNLEKFSWLLLALLLCCTYVVETSLTEGIKFGQ